MDESQALEIFAGTDETAARQAFDFLSELNRPRLRRYLIRWRLSAEEREDVIQNTFLKVWEFRPRFQNMGVAAWHGLLYKIAYQCCIDILGDREELIDDSAEESDVPDTDLPVVGAIIDAVLTATEVEELDHCAHLLWLGLDPALSAATHERQLILAQLYYLDGDSWEDAVRSLPTGSSNEPPLTRATFNAWMSHPGVICYLAYHLLYYSNDRLAGYLLGLPEPVSPSALSSTLDDLMQQATAPPPEVEPPGGWSWAEVAVVLWRYRYALLIEDILRRKDCPAKQKSSESLLVLIGRLTAQFPFNIMMTKLLAGLDRVRNSGARAILTKSGLWKRLAFQYRFRHDLPHRDIQDRTQPAATLVGYSVTLDMLNAWLSKGRLLQELARFYQETKGDDDE